MKKGETDIRILLKTMNPELNEGEYVFCSLEDNIKIDLADVIGCFKEKEGVTIIVEKKVAEKMNLSYSSVTSWITLTVHSSLEAIGLTAAFSGALAAAAISCNVIAGYYHDHIFIPVKDRQKAMKILIKISRGSK
jgi:hypothetical protein